MGDDIRRHRWSDTEWNTETRRRPLTSVILIGSHGLDEDEALAPGSCGRRGLPLALSS